jgi:hypothetical protein
MKFDVLKLSVPLEVIILRHVIIEIYWVQVSGRGLRPLNRLTWGV